MALEVRCWGGTVSAGSPGASRSNPKVARCVSPREVREHPPLGRGRCFAREQQGRGRRELLGGLIIGGRPGEGGLRPLTGVVACGPCPGGCPAGSGPEHI